MIDGINGSIVIYNNNKKDIDNVITSFFLSKKARKLYIIDNSPTDEAKYWITDKRIEYIKNENTGYGSSHNIALKRSISESRYHVVLNPDIYFEANVLNELSNYMDLNDNVGLVMPKVMYPNGDLQKLCKLIPTPLNLIIRRFLPKFLTKGLDHDYEYSFTDYNQIVEVPILSGCFMFIRTSTLKLSGLFDERFFMYCEDFDFSRRLNTVSKTIYYPKVNIVHAHAKESYKSLKMLKIHISSAVKYFNKWGWFFDQDRKRVNSYMLEKYKNKEIYS